MPAHRWRAVLAVATVLFVGAVPSIAGVIEDQSNTGSTNAAANINECCKFIAQSLTAGVSGTLDSVAIDVSSSLDEFPLHVAIRPMEDGVPAATVLGEVTITTSDSPLSNLIEFPRTIEIVAGEQYAIVVNYEGAPPPGPGQSQGFWLGNFPDPYPYGQAFSSELDGVVWIPNSNSDLFFVTFVDVNDGDVPATTGWGMGLIAAILLGWSTAAILQPR